mgnify:CR=1 FL=1
MVLNKPHLPLVNHHRPGSRQCIKVRRHRLDISPRWINSQHVTDINFSKCHTQEQHLHAPGHTHAHLPTRVAQTLTASGAALNAVWVAGRRLVARGEVVVVEDRLGVTMTEIIKDGDSA